MQRQFNSSIYGKSNRLTSPILKQIVAFHRNFYACTQERNQGFAKGWDNGKKIMTAF